MRQRRDELANITPSLSNWSRITEWHARTRPLISQQFSSELDAFDQLLAVSWVRYPKFIAVGRYPADNSRSEAAENASNQKVVQNAHAKLLAHIDALIELYNVDDGSESDTQESDSIFIEIDQLIASSYLSALS
jgi:hypothetical protein